MAAISLTDLAPELKRAIFCSENICPVVYETGETYCLLQLRRLTDLYNLCLVCKDLYLHASPVLYETVTLDRQKLLKVGYTSGVVSHATGGRSPVRHLTFEGWEDPTDVSSIVPLLQAFPRDSLYSVQWSRHSHDLPISAVELLLRSQGKLRYLRLPPVQGSFLGIKDANHLPCLKHLELELGIFIKMLPVTEFAQGLLQKSTENPLESLSIRSHVPLARTHQNFGQSDAQLRNNFLVPLHDRSDEDGFLFQTLFKHMKSSKSYVPMRLKHLMLEEIRLDHASRTYCKAMDFSALETLTLKNCSGCWAIFKLMVKNALQDGLNLKRLSYATEEDIHAKALDNLLQSFSGLRQLLIVNRGSRALPVTASIAHHGGTLSALLIDCQKLDGGLPFTLKCGVPLCYTADDIKRICESCPLLRQLGLTFPTFPRSTDDEIRLPEEPQCRDFVDELNCLSQLHTLHVVNWAPDYDGSEEDLPVGFRNYDLLLNEIGNEIMHDLCSNKAGQVMNSKIIILKLGSQAADHIVSLEHYPSDQASRMRCKYYIRGELHDFSGSIKVVAVPAELPDIWRIQPESEMISFNNNGVLEKDW